MGEFPLNSPWGSEAEQRRWGKVLRRTGPENVRARLAQADYGSAGAIAIGTEHSMTKGFAEEWLAWHDEQKLAAEEAHRALTANWTKAAGIGALVAAAAAVVAAIASVAQLFVAGPK